MTAARLARRWQEAGENRAVMAEALVDEIDHPDAGLVSRDFLRAELQTLRDDPIGTIGRVVLTVFGVQVVLVGALVAFSGRDAGDRRGMRGRAPLIGAAAQWQSAIGR